MRACVNHLARCNYRARPRQASGLNGLRQLGAPVKHETSHPSALLGTPSRGCAGPCRRHYRTGGGTKASARRPPRTGTAGSWVGARCCPVLGSAPAADRFLGRRPPVAGSRVGAPLSPPVPARQCRRQLMVSHTRWAAWGWMVGEEIALRAHAMPSIRRKDRTQCGPHRRVRVATRRPSKTAGCRPLRTTLLTKDNQL